MVEKEIDPLREEFGKSDSDSTLKVIPWLKEVEKVIPDACEILEGSFDGLGNSTKYVWTIDKIKNLYQQATRFQHCNDVFTLTSFLEKFVGDMNCSMDLIALCDMIKLMRSRFYDFQMMGYIKMFSWHTLYRSYFFHASEVHKMHYLWPVITPKIDEIDLHVELLVKLNEAFHHRRDPKVMTVVSSMYDILIMKSGVCTVENLKDWLSKISDILTGRRYYPESADPEAHLILNDKEDIKTDGFTKQLIEAAFSLRNAERVADRQRSAGWSLVGMETWFKRVTMLEYRVRLIISIHNSRNSLDLLCPDFLTTVKRTTLFCEIQVKLFYGKALDIFHSPVPSNLTQSEVSALVPSNSTQREVSVGQSFTGFGNVSHGGKITQNNYLSSKARKKRERTNKRQKSDGTKERKVGERQESKGKTGNRLARVSLAFVLFALFFFLLFFLFFLFC